MTIFICGEAEIITITIREKKTWVSKHIFFRRENLVLMINKWINGLSNGLTYKIIVFNR